MRGRKRFRLLSSISIMAGMLLIFSGLIAAQAGFTGAMPAFWVIGDDVGLRVDPADASWFEDVDNLNPGDRKESTVTVKNEGELPFTAAMTMKRLDEPEEIDLLQQLELTVTYRGEVIYQGPMAGFTETVDLDRIPVGGEADIHFSVYLPGPETGNEYQGTSGTVQLVFTANRIQPPDDNYVDILLVKEIVDENDTLIGGYAPHNDVPFTFTVNGLNYTVTAKNAVYIFNQQPGEFTISEVTENLPAGYEYVSGGGTFTFGPGLHTVTIRNRYLGPGPDKATLILEKVVKDSDGNDISDLDTVRNIPFFVEVNGEVYEVSTGAPYMIAGLEPGTYEVKEVEMPEGYVHVDGGGEYELDAGTEMTVTITNAIESIIDIVPEPPEIAVPPRTTPAITIISIPSMLVGCA